MDYVFVSQVEDFRTLFVLFFAYMYKRCFCSQHISITWRQTCRVENDVSSGERRVEWRKASSGGVTKARQCVCKEDIVIGREERPFLWKKRVCLDFDFSTNWVGCNKIFWIDSILLIF